MTAIIVTLEDGVQWHAHTVFACATSHGLSASIESITPQDGLITAKSIMRVVVRDGIAPNGQITRRASAFPIHIFYALPGVARIETRDHLSF